MNSSPSSSPFRKRVDSVSKSSNSFTRIGITWPGTFSSTSGFSSEPERAAASWFQAMRAPSGSFRVGIGAPDQGLALNLPKGDLNKLFWLGAGVSGRSGPIRLAPVGRSGLQPSAPAQRRGAKSAFELSARGVHLIHVCHVSGATASPPAREPPNAALNSRSPNPVRQSAHEAAGPSRRANGPAGPARYSQAAGTPAGARRPRAAPLPATGCVVARAERARAVARMKRSRRRPRRRPPPRGVGSHDGQLGTAVDHGAPRYRARPCRRCPFSTMTPCCAPCRRRPRRPGPGGVPALPFRRLVMPPKVYLQSPPYGDFRAMPARGTA